ncbi:site-specific integrase, partial [Puia sp.]|uniref:site-specific integrase n=1 Tax=Puia sp. TaxID=2045100 RepID=UPI002F42488C
MSRKLRSSTFTNRAKQRIKMSDSVMEKSLGILFFLRKPSPMRPGPRLVFLRITVDGIPKELSLKRTWDKNKWQPNPGRTTGTAADAKALNAFLDIIRAKVYEARRILIETGKAISAVAIRDIVSGAAERNRMLFKVYQGHNDTVKALIGLECSDDLWEKHERVLNYLKEFVTLKYKLTDISIYSVDHEFGQSFYTWLRTVRKCSHNTASAYIGFFKKIILSCIDNGWLQADPFAKLNLTLDEVEPVFLTEVELELIAEKEIKNERLSIIRDIFIFSCLTSLAYIDVKQLKKSEVTIGHDGNLWIDKKRQKSKVPSRVPLLPLTRRILDKYRNNPRCVAEDRLLPVISNAKYNEYLKEIAAICGVEK